MATMPYIHFQGRCAEAMQFYSKVFGGTDLQMMPYTQMPGGDEREGAGDRIMHSQVTLADGTLMASDYPPGVVGDAQAGWSILQTAPDVATGQRWFNALCDGGAEIHPYGPTFFSPAFGMAKDRFGTHWIISVTSA